MILTDTTIQEARELLRNHSHGVLSTISLSLEGSPFGSVATYCVDRAGEPLALFSTIAEHSKNLLADAKCSLTVLQGEGGNVQAKSRITVSGEMQKLESEDSIVERYYRYFPEAREYRKFHDFDFYGMSVSKVRYIGGFGKIHWIEPEQFKIEGPFSEAEETMILAHMNDQHRDSLVAYFALLKGMKLSGDEQLEMCGIDTDGFDIRMNGNHYRFKTEEQMLDTDIARKVLTDLARQAAQNKG
jgi:putative heme iron utilization protein